MIVVFPDHTHFKIFSKYLKIGTCPASQNLLAYIGKTLFSLEISNFSLALQPEAIGRVLFSSPVIKVIKNKLFI